MSRTLCNKYWKIDIYSWGDLWAIGTEIEAEEWRVHKTQWERSAGIKTEVKKEDLPNGRVWRSLKELGS